MRTTFTTLLTTLFLTACGPSIAPQLPEPQDPVVEPAAETPVAQDTSPVTTTPEPVKLSKVSTCSLLNPKAASGATVLAKLELRYTVYRYSDGSALVTAQDIRPEGERSVTKLYSVKESKAKVALPLTLNADVDAASGGSWTFTLFSGDGAYGAQVQYDDQGGSAWNRSSWWVACKLEAAE